MAGLLDALTWLDQKRKNAANTVRGLLSDPQQELAQMGSYAMQPVSELRQASQDWNSPDPATKQRGQDAMLNALLNMGGVGAIKVFHGSPHTFDKFDMAKIGTGEGAQAYGHGLYFAENPAVADMYKRNLTFQKLNAKDASYQRDLQAAQMLAADVPMKSIKNAMKNLEVPEKDVQSVIDRGQKILDSQPSATYEASLRWPDPAREAADPLGPQHFLQWDKPLSEQSQVVKDKLSKIGVKETSPDLIQEAKAQMMDALARKDSQGFGQAQADWTRLAYPPTGQQIYRDFPSDSRASQVMQQAGIPGIRYLDAGSRGAGEGTANYVVFDPNLIEILKRNGQPLGLLNQ